MTTAGHKPGPEILTTSTVYTKRIEEKILYPSMALTITEDRVFSLESQHATAIVINAAPAILPITIAPGSVIEMPSNMETTKDGIIAIANPVAPSSSAVIVNNDFILFEVYLLVYEPRPVITRVIPASMGLEVNAPPLFCNLNLL
jgi:hypothetical protein